jgi:glycosyltransferase involved in cell wall biosynthesis
VINIPQCIPEEDFQTKQDVVETILTQYGRYILYIGTITSEVSIELLDKIAREFPSITLLIVGPVLRLSDELLESIKKLQLNSNVYFTGSVDGRELKNYIVGAEVCLVPYKFESERKVRVRSPLKILNYISHYRPVVTSIESEIPDSGKMGVCLVKNESDFIARIREILNNGSPSQKNLINDYLKGIRYPERIREILSHLA